MDEKLNFPRIKGEMLPPSIRSLDEIDAWIEHDYRLFFNRERYEEEKRRLSVDKPFTLDK